MLGTPNEDTWPGVSALPDWNTEFPKFPPLQLSRFLPGMNEEGIDLLEQILTLDPRRRLTATEALAHPYFAGVKMN